MNLTDAAYAVAHDYPGGTESLAPRLGMSGAILRGKVNPNDKSHHLTLAEAMRMQSMTGDFRILHAMAGELGFVCVQMPSFANTSEMELLDSFMSVMKELGEFSAEFRKDWEDGEISKHELKRIKQEFYEMQQAGIELMQRIEALAEQSSK